MNTPRLNLNPAYILAPFEAMLSSSFTRVLLGMRLVENVAEFPPPTAAELQLFQFAFARTTTIHDEKNLFAQWILLNGFADMIKAMREGLERLLVYEELRLNPLANPKADIGKLQRELEATTRDYNVPSLLSRLKDRFPTELTWLAFIDSCNRVRNCLEHTKGILTERHCDRPAQDKLTVTGQRFCLFFEKDNTRTPAQLGQAGPENAALMLGAELFSLEFTIGQAIEISLPQLIDILNTCIFIRSEIALAIKT